jgi:hypothetical protein
MSADVDRDGLWAVNALLSAADHGAGSTSVGCEIRERDSAIVIKELCQAALRLVHRYERAIRPSALPSPAARHASRLIKAAAPFRGANRFDRFRPISRRKSSQYKALHE